jgi:hypothetical protein
MAELNLGEERLEEGNIRRSTRNSCTSSSEVEARGATDGSVGIGDEDNTAAEGVVEAEGVDKRGRCRCIL